MRIKRQKYIKVCPCCDETFFATRKDAKYCSSGCRSYVWQQRNKINIETIELPKQTTSFKPIISESDILTPESPQKIKIESKANAIPIKEFIVYTSDYGISVGCPCCGVNYLTHINGRLSILGMVSEFKRHLLYVHQMDSDNAGYYELKMKEFLKALYTKYMQID